MVRFVLVFWALLLAIPAAARGQPGRPTTKKSETAKKVVAAITKVLATEGWITDDDLALGSVAAWDKRKDGKVLLRLTLSTLDSGPIQDFADHIKKRTQFFELLADIRRFKTALFSDAEFVMRMKGSKENGSYHWNRRIAFEGDEGLILMATIALRTKKSGKDALLHEVGEKRPGLQSAFATFLGLKLAGSLRIGDKGRALRLAHAGMEHTLTLPKAWVRLPVAKGIAAWRPKKGAGRVRFGAYAAPVKAGAADPLVAFLSARIQAFGGQGVKYMKQPAVKNGVASATFTQSIEGKGKRWVSLVAQRAGQLLFVLEAASAKPTSTWKARVRMLFRKWKIAPPR